MVQSSPQMQYVKLFFFRGMHLAHSNQRVNPKLLQNFNDRTSFEKWLCIGYKGKCTSFSRYGGKKAWKNVTWCSQSYYPTTEPSNGMTAITHSSHTTSKPAHYFLHPNSNLFKNTGFSKSGKELNRAYRCWWINSDSANWRLVSYSVRIGYIRHRNVLLKQKTFIPNPE